MNFSLLSFGFFKIEIYGLFLAFAFALGLWKFYQVLTKKALKPDIFAHYFWIWLLSGLVVGRLFVLLLIPYVFSDYGWYSFFAFWEGGVYSYALFATFLGLAFYYLRDKDKLFWRWLDHAVFPFLFALMIVDLGGFFTGGVYGTPAEFNGSTLPWGIQYETLGVNILSAVHPVTIYLFILHGLLFGFLWRRRTKLSRRIGQKGAFALIGIVLADFITSFFRSYNYGIVSGINIHQLLLVGLFLFLTITYIRKYARS